MPVAVVTGASRGLGLALARALAQRGWKLVVDARGRQGLRAAAATLKGSDEVVALVGDVADEAHRRQLMGAARELGGLDLLVNNASTLGPTPLPGLAEYPLEALEAVYAVNVVAPIRLFQLALPQLQVSAASGGGGGGGGGKVVNVTSDAAREAYAGWGGYGSSKAALEQLSNVAAAEHPELRVWWVDPGDMRTQMHQDAFPGEDISDRPLPEESVPGLLHLIDGNLPSGRYRTAELGALARSA
jgi:NAD(P)-dependent dehydrogenase (short-subunit alcohol dehydrogenase family)